MRELAGLTTRVENNVLVVSITGEIDTSNAGDIEERIGAAIPRDTHGLVVDLTGVRYLDSSGIHLLFRAKSRLAVRRLPMSVILPPDSPVARVLDVAQLSSAIPVARSLEEAIAEIRAAG